MVQVTTLFNGANAVNVEQAVATPIEQQVNGVEEMLVHEIHQRSRWIAYATSFI
jgi:multidrug efflux pump subunit AcrB